MNASLGIFRRATQSLALIIHAGGSLAGGCRRRALRILILCCEPTAHAELSELIACMLMRSVVFSLAGLATGQAGLRLTLIIHAGGSLAAGCRRPTRVND